MSIKYIVCIIAIFVQGCTQHRITNIENKISEKEKWIEIYRKEISIAVDNDDAWAVYFFKTEIRQLKTELEQIKKEPK